MNAREIRDQCLSAHVSPEDMLDYVGYWAEFNPRFDREFIDKLRDSLEYYGYLTDRQEEALKNIIKKWRMKSWYLKRIQIEEVPQGNGLHAKLEELRKARSAAHPDLGGPGGDVFHEANKALKEFRAQHPDIPDQNFEVDEFEELLNRI